MTVEKKVTFRGYSVESKGWTFLLHYTESWVVRLVQARVYTFFTAKKDARAPSRVTKIYEHFSRKSVKELCSGE